MQDAAKFVQAVMDHLGASSPAALAETMRWKRGVERTVSRWLAGAADPNYGYTMGMLRKCGWINMNGDAPASDQSDSDPPQPIAVTLRDLLSGQQIISRQLEQIEQRVEAALPPAPSKRRSK